MGRPDRRGSGDGPVDVLSPFPRYPTRPRAGDLSPPVRFPCGMPLRAIGAMTDTGMEGSRGRYRPEPGIAGIRREPAQPPPWRAFSQRPRLARPVPTPQSDMGLDGAPARIPPAECWVSGNLPETRGPRGGRGIRQGLDISGKKRCRREDSNPRPMHYECIALPAELLRPDPAPDYPQGTLRCKGANGGPWALHLHPRLTGGGTGGSRRWVHVGIFLRL